MKRLLLPLLAALALPTAVNAETIWLLVSHVGGGIQKIEMIDMDTCEKESKKLKKAHPFAPKITGTYCIKGK